MASETQIFDPDGDLTLILPTVTPQYARQAQKREIEEGELRHKKLVQSKNIRMLVSSKHMMLASPVFKAMLTHSFREGESLRATSRVEVDLPDDDHFIFTILLDIIHGRGRRIPRQVSLQYFAIMACPVDKYQLQETLEYHTEAWAANCKELATLETFPARWLIISWVFRLKDEFTEVTRLLMTGLHEPDHCIQNSAEYHNIDVPVPDLIIDTMKKQRSHAAQIAYGIVDSMITLYQGSVVSWTCSCQKDEVLSCESLVLGSLLKSARGFGLWPKPRFPLTDPHLPSIKQSMFKLNVESRCLERAREVHRHIIDELRDRTDIMLNGLNLDDFPSSGKRVPRNKELEGLILLDY